MYREIFNQLSVKFNLLPIIGKDIDNNYYILFYEIRIMNRKYLFTNDTGYGINEEEAIKNLFNIYLDKRYLIRKKTNKGYIYFTTKMRNEIKKMLKKEGMMNFV